MNRTKLLRLLLFLLITFMASCFFIFHDSSSQQIIEKVKFSDGVKKWYRVKSSDGKPWLFKQVEAVFNVIIATNKDLPFGKSVAFVVGVSRYQNISPQLPFVENDLNDMREFLLNQGGFDEVYVARGDIVHRDLVEKYLKKILRSRLKAEDRLLFFYSGHGDDDGGNTGYMQFSKAAPGEFYGQQVLKISDAETWCSEIKIKHLLFIFDCCASGLAFTPRGKPADEVQQMIATLSGNGSRAVMTAGTANEKTYEVKDSRGRGNGVFTRAFLNALSSGRADQKRDGFITIDEVIAEVKNEIASFASRYHQRVTPRLWPIDVGNYGGTFVFVNPRAREQGVQFRNDYAVHLPAIPRGKKVAEIGIIQLRSFVSGDVYIDGSYIGKIESGDVFNYDQPVGKHKVQVITTTKSFSGEVYVSKGEIKKVSIGTPSVTPIRKPEIKPALSTLFRPTPKELSKADVKSILRKRDFYCKEREWNKEYSNPGGKGFDNKFETKMIRGDKVVIDHASGLMWQQSGSPNYMTFEKAQQWIKDLNENGYAGYSNWRLPTLEEAMSLMEPKKNKHNLYIDPVFDNEQTWIWTSDPYQGAAAQWVVGFGTGSCYSLTLDSSIYVRAVRFGQSSP